MISLFIASLTDLYRCIFLLNFRVIYTQRMLTTETVKEIWEFRCPGNLCRALAIIYRKCYVYILGALTTELPY